MSKITLCPHYLVNYPYQDADDIEANLIDILVNFLDLIEEENIGLTLSQVIYDYFHETFPWNLPNDGEWGATLGDWRSAIFPALARAELVNHDLMNTSEDSCEKLSEDIQAIFNSFLDTFGKKGIANQLNEEAIFVNKVCSYPANYKSFLIVDESFNNLNILAFPWLRIYPSSRVLPTEGEFKFIPPDNWKDSLQPLKSTQSPYGFIDYEGKVWCWDKLHKNHWDVQKSVNSGRGEYVNVSPEGVLL